MAGAALSLSRDSIGVVARIVALGAAALLLAFLLDAVLTFRLGLPGGASPFAGGAPLLGWAQMLLYPASLALVATHVLYRSGEGLMPDSRRLAALAALIVRAAFWTVLIVGVADMVISFLRVEGFLEPLFGDWLAKRLGVSSWRGTVVHLPLLALSILIALRWRSLAFVWLALLVVVAQFAIVIARFIFSYEQAFMGDLVRFWYAALFLFASAETLVQEGHVRVDVFYAEFSERRKAWTNCIGSVLLGAPLCVTVLALGLAERTSIIASPILSFETTQAGFGMYVKYMMAGFLAVFAMSMLAQFASSFLRAAAVLLDDPAAEPPAEAAAAH